MRDAEPRWPSSTASSPPTRPRAERLRALRAGLRFDLGERDAAIAEMEALIDAMEPSDERRSIMVMLARMLDTTGNNVGARALVEEVLEEDASPEALKLRAGWLIDDDRIDEAIVALRSGAWRGPQRCRGDDPDGRRTSAPAIAT